MTAITLRQAINESFVNRLTGLAGSSSSSGSSLASALQGGSSQTQISDGLRVGARTFAVAVQGLNGAITVANVTEASLDRLGKLTDEMIDLAEEATKPSVGAERKGNISSKFRELGKDFEKIIEQTKVNDKKILSAEGLSDYLVQVGLDKDTSDSIANLFEEFSLGDDGLLASGEITGKRPLNIPADAGGSPRAYSSVFDAELSHRPTAYAALEDLRALSEQIEKNTGAIRDAREIIGKNLDLVRATGFALLDLSEQVSNELEAKEVAEELREKIRDDAPAALSQAENLEPIIVAALALDPNNLT